RRRYTWSDEASRFRSRCWPRVSPVGRSNALRFLKARAAQHAAKRVVALVACVFVDRFVRSDPRILSGPAPIPGRGMLEGEAIEQRLVVDAREAFDDVEVLARSAELSLSREVGRVDDERVAFPSADRIAQPLPDRGGRMRAADPDDPRVV